MYFAIHENDINRIIRVWIICVCVLAMHVYVSVFDVEVIGRTANYSIICEINITKKPRSCSTFRSKKGNEILQIKIELQFFHTGQSSCKWVSQHIYLSIHLLPMFDAVTTWKWSGATKRKWMRMRSCCAFYLFLRSRCDATENQIFKFFTAPNRTRWQGRRQWQNRRRRNGMNKHVEKWPSAEEETATMAGEWKSPSDPLWVYERKSLPK